MSWLNRLGFWNRLALVSGSAASFGGSSWYAISANRERGAAMAAGYKACISATPDWDLCSNLWNRSGPAVSLDEWGILLSISAVGCLIVYGFVWLLIWLSKWVWRGRGKNNSDPA